jgi:hypothetical protein
MRWLAATRMMLRRRSGFRRSDWPAHTAGRQPTILVRMNVYKAHVGPICIAAGATAAAGRYGSPARSVHAFGRSL